MINMTDGQYEGDIEIQTANNAPSLLAVFFVKYTNRIYWLLPCLRARLAFHF